MSGICFIVSQLPPAMCGVGDYSMKLRAYWDAQYDAVEPDRHDLGTSNWSFLVIRGGERTRIDHPELRIEQVQGSMDDMRSKLEDTQASVVILQYSGYGFAESGAPHWLADALAEWKAADSSRHVVVMFHETWVLGCKPWHRDFWYGGSQKRCAARLFTCASAVVCSVKINARRLEGLGHSTDIHIIPIPSNLVVPKERILNSPKNWKHAVIFGLAPIRLRAVKQHLQLIRRMLLTGRWERIVLCGGQANSDLDPAEVLLQRSGLSKFVETRYNFSTDAVPVDIITCGFAIMNSDSRFLNKSGVYSGAAALGQVPIAIQVNGETDGLESGCDYIGYQNHSLEDVIASLSSTDIVKKIAERCLSMSLTTRSWENTARQWVEIVSRVSAK